MHRTRILNAIIKKFAYTITEDIIRFAKSTKPFKMTSYGKKIDLDKYAEECFNKSLLNDKKIVSEIDKSEREYEKGVFTKFDSSNKLLQYLRNI